MTIAKSAALSLFAVLILAGLSVTGPASAQTISYQQAVGELANACGADITKYCKNTNIGGGMMACMNKNMAKVSQQCKVTFAATQASLNKREAAQTAIWQICEPDIKRLCKEYDPGNGRYLRCLLKFGSKVGAPCNQAITDAGWR